MRARLVIYPHDPARVVCAIGENDPVPDDYEELEIVPAPLGPPDATDPCACGDPRSRHVHEAAALSSHCTRKDCGCLRFREAG